MYSVRVAFNCLFLLDFLGVVKSGHVELALRRDSPLQASAKALSCFGVEKRFGCVPLNRCNRVSSQSKRDRVPGSLRKGRLRDVPNEILWHRLQPRRFVLWNESNTEALEGTFWHRLPSGRLPLGGKNIRRNSEPDGFLNPGQVN